MITQVRKNSKKKRVRQNKSHTVVEREYIYEEEGYIFRTEAGGKFWSVSFWIPEEKKEYRKSLKTKNKVEALIRAKERESFSKLYDELNKKINSLLPGAGAAGLASSYYQAKMRYTTTNDISLEDNDVTKKMKLSWYEFFPQWGSYLFNLFLFLAPLVVLFVTFMDFNYPTIFEGQPYAVLMYKLTLTLPLVAVSTYGVISLVVNKRMYEDYNHKQRVMQLYHSFKKEIESTTDEPLKAKLLNVMLDVVKDKPSSKVGKHDKSFFESLQSPIEKIADKILGSH